MEEGVPFLNKNAASKQTNVAIVKKFELEPPAKTNIYFLRQILGNFTMVFLCILGSITTGYSAILLPQLKKPDSIIKITKVEESWIAAVIPLQMGVGCIISMLTMDKLGRKGNNILSTIIALLSWATIYYSTSLICLLIGRALGGFYTGLCATSITAYMAEISSTRYRGVFLSFIAFGIASGIFISHILGTFFSWQNTALAIMAIPIILLELLIYLPESHVWYLNRNNSEEARKSFNWFRGPSEIEIDEFNKMLEKPATAKRTISETITECKKKEFYHPLLILFLFFSTMQSSGTNVVTFYSVDLMQLTVPSLEKYSANIIIDLSRIVFSILASALTKRFKVRLLLFISIIGTIISLFSLSFFVYMAEKYPENKWFTTVPIVFLMTYILFITIGLIPLPWTICGEILPVAMKGIGAGIAVAVNCLAFFLIVKTSPFLIEALGTHGSFSLYACLLSTGAIALYFVLPETKNRTLQEIQESFKPRASNIYNVYTRD